MGTSAAARRIAGVGAVVGTISARRVGRCAGRFDMTGASSELSRAAASRATARVTNAGRNTHNAARTTASRSTGRTVSDSTAARGKHNAVHASRTTAG